MKSVFADAFYFIALLSPNDHHYDKTKRLARELKAKYVTTDWIIMEVADALSKGRARRHIGGLVEHLRASAIWEVVPSTSALFDAALELHSQYHDKEWTLTDCTSFLVMRERGITEALTGDHHFEQAGFIALLK